MRHKARKISYGKTYHTKYPPHKQECWRVGSGCKEYRLQSWERLHGIGEVSKKKIKELAERKSIMQNYPPRLESMERLLQITNKVGNTSSLTWSAGDYQDVKIEDNSVIYADIPYKSTNTYVGEGKDFDYERFYDWCLKQTQPLFISSYEMPKSDFRVVAEFNRRDTMSASSNSNNVTERIFIPRTQEYINKELKLF